MHRTEHDMSATMPYRETHIAKQRLADGPGEVVDAQHESFGFSAGLNRLGA
jgi:hypothetical protein